MPFCRLQISRKTVLETIVEILAVFAVFALFGAWMVPDVNETHYIGKAIHFWNPDWIQGDDFLESRDAHWTFYLAFGWLSFFCCPASMAWLGRIAAWGLLAWSWQRLSYALIPVRWVAIPTALALAYYIESFNMAGEWLIGGIEGKSLAYPFLFFALEAMLRKRWNHVGIFLGIACAFHILVGGWAVIICGAVFLGDTVFSKGSRRKVSFPVIGLLGGGSLALCGLVPALLLNVGTSADIINEANRIYVFERLQHHLVPYAIRDAFVLRFALLTLLWFIFCQYTFSRKHRTFNAFVWGTLVLSAIGMVLAYSNMGNKDFSATVLRLYWFRLADVAVPMGIALGAARFCFSYKFAFNTSSLAGSPADCIGTPSQMEEDFGRNNVLFPIAFTNLFTTVLSTVAAVAVIFFLVNYFFFTFFKFSPPDQGAVWAMTLLLCYAFLLLYRWRLYRQLHRRRQTNSAPIPSSATVSSTTSSPVLLLFYIAILFYAPLTSLPKYADLRMHAAYCRSEPVGPHGRRAAEEWKNMCVWIKRNTEPAAKFWIPRDGQTFKWHAQRADVGSWKNIPQDAASIVQWRQAVRGMNELFHYINAEGEEAEDRLITSLLNSKTEEELAEMQQRYGFTYIVCAQAWEMPSHSQLVRVYENDVYCLYRVIASP